jgi:outer membrane receptor protein involved in Fe transport
MKNFSSCFHLARVLVAALVAVGSASAQSSAPKPVAAGADEEVTELSPFTVNASRDRGFVATSSLAGGRIATDMKDTPVAYSVITREFIEALGITDLNRAASWTPNTSIVISGNGGGFAEDVGNFGFGVTVRGGGQGDQQRNFFYYRAPMDSFSIERYDFGRGPNAILFGNGGLGGVNSSTTKVANFGRNSTVISQDVGSWSKMRSTVDSNYVVSDKLAIRVAGVYEDDRGYRDRQFFKTDGVFLTGTYKLGRNTSIRVEGEYGTWSRQQTNTNLIDNFSGWDGKTTYTGPITGTVDEATYGPIGVNKRGAGYLVWDPFSSTNAVMNYQNDPNTISGDATKLTPLGNFVRNSLPAFGGANAWIVGAQNVPANRFDRAVAGSNFRVPNERFSTNFDKPTLTQRFKDIQVTVDHRIGDIFLQLAADSNRTRQEIFSVDVRGNQQIYIDINRNLPNGAINGHFLQPYSDSNLRYQRPTFDHDGIRFAAGTLFDLGKWGNYKVNLMGGYSEITSKQFTYNLSVRQNPDHRRWGATGREMAPTDLIRVRNYWNEESRPLIYRTDPIRYIDPIAGIDKMVTPALVIENDRADSAQSSRAIYGYGIASLQGKYFNDKLVLLGAVRMDNFYNHTRQQVSGGDYDAANWDGLTPIYRANAPADYFTMKYTPKDNAGVPNKPAEFAANRPRDAAGNRNPLYANDRFRNDYNAPAVKGTRVTKTIGTVVHATSWFSPYVNYAETFNPPVPIQRLDSSFLEPTVAKGMDYGVRFTLLNDRLNVNVLYFDNKEKNNGFNPGLPVTAIISARKADDTGVTSTNQRGVAALPLSFNDIREREARGTEIEVTANVTPAWRVMGNIARAKTYQANAYQDTIPYIDANLPVFRLILQDAGVLIDSNNFATIDASNPAPKLDANAAANQWNTLMTYRRGLYTGRTLVNDQITANFFNDYTIQTGFLRSLRGGIGVQWRGKQILDNRGGDTIVDPSDPTKAIDDPRVGATDFYYTDPYWSVVGTLGYTWKLQHNRTVEVNLRLDNLLKSSGVIQAQGGIYRPVDGDYSSPARQRVPFNYQYQLPTNYTLSAKLSF